METPDQVPKDGDMHAGYAGVALPVRRTDGTPAVLKIAYPDRLHNWEATLLATWSGSGAVLLLNRDDGADDGLHAQVATDLTD